MRREASLLLYLLCWYLEGTQEWWYKLENIYWKKLLKYFYQIMKWIKKSQSHVRKEEKGTINFFQHSRQIWKGGNTARRASQREDERRCRPPAAWAAGEPVRVRVRVRGGSLRGDLERTSERARERAERGAKWSGTLAVTGTASSCCSGRGWQSMRSAATTGPPPWRRWPSSTNLSPVKTETSPLRPRRTWSVPSGLPGGLAAASSRKPWPTGMRRKKVKAYQA